MTCKFRFANGFLCGSPCPSGQLYCNKAHKPQPSAQEELFKAFWAEHKDAPYMPNKTQARIVFNLAYPMIKEAS